MDAFGNRMSDSELGEVLGNDFSIERRGTTETEGEEEDIVVVFELTPGGEFKLSVAEFSQQIQGTPVDEEPLRIDTAVFGAERPGSAIRQGVFPAGIMSSVRETSSVMCRPLSSGTLGASSRQVPTLHRSAVRVPR